jgi:hypothetical protein
MPRGANGEKRPADVTGAAVMVAKIATGEIEDTKSEKNFHAAALGTFRYSSAAPTAPAAARLASAS